LVTLSCAYGSVLETLISNLSLAGLNMGKVADLGLRDWSRLMAAFYFSEPVRQDTIELSRLYNAVKERQKISLLALEATDQLRLLADLVRLDRNEMQARREKRMQLSFTIFGIALTLLGLIQIAQVTPKMVVDFRDVWTACIRDNGVKRCLLGEPNNAREPTASPLPSKRLPREHVPRNEKPKAAEIPQ
jgi:hypothetical protein